MTVDNHIPPERTTPEQRQREVAQILARGIARARMARQMPFPPPAPHSEVSVDLTGNPRVNANPSYTHGVRN